MAGTTTSVALTGSGFVSGTVLTTSLGSVTGSYVSATSMLAQVALPANATGNVSIQAQNHSPGGGTSAALQVPVYNIRVTATDPDGTNTGTARLGVPVSLSAIANAGNWHSITWTLQGAGKLSYVGTAAETYTPPTTMPTNASVTITASMASDTAITTSYAFSLINPVPTVSSASPAQLLTGGTQPVVLVGSGFVPGTVASLNGVALATTYTNSSALTVQVPVATNAKGTLNLLLQSSGGVVGPPFPEIVIPNSITLTATGVDGVNTGFADIDFSVAISAAVTGSMQTAVNWNMTGAGSISSAGVYTPPAVMPANPAVTIQAALASNPAITASYQVNIVNPVPTITGASPAIIPAGATTTVTFTGTGFVPSTVIESNGSAMPTTYVSPTSITAKISVIAVATGRLHMQAYTATGTGGLSDFFPVAISAPVSLTTAGRLLDQTSFGPTTSLIQHVQNEGVTAWLMEQFNTPTTVLANISSTPPTYCPGPTQCAESEWWAAVLTGNDQLRQRVAFALSELFVVGDDTVGSDQAITAYSNMLANDAFSNWYTIMNDVTLSPAMGVYLDMLNSYRPTATEIANENFARENMQLYNIGLFLLNQDGTPQQDANGNPIPAYTEAQVQAFARLYTGWTYANQDGSTPSNFNSTPNFYHPMVAVEEWHDENPKTLLNGTTLAAGKTAEEDLAGGLTNIFQHPNTPPFVCKQLIQHLVKSDPSPAYISRVAAKFINDGNGVRGDMEAVLTAILTDPEARAGDVSSLASDGHLREPILWMTAVMRGLGYVNVDPNNFYWYMTHYSRILGEAPYESPSVFNFFPIGYVIPGTTLSAPEFGLENTGSVSDRLGMADTLVSNKIDSFNVDLSSTSPLGQIAVSQGPAALVNALSDLFLYGTMDSNTAAAITSEINTVADPAQQVRLAVYLVITSTEYKILH